MRWFTCYNALYSNQLAGLHVSQPGLPPSTHALIAGMMCTISASREMGLDTSDLPLHIFGPAGLAEYLRCGKTTSLTTEKHGRAACAS